MLCWLDSRIVDEQDWLGYLGDSSSDMLLILFWASFHVGLYYCTSRILVATVD